MSLLTVVIIGLVLLILAIILFLMAGKSLVFGDASTSWSQSSYRLLGAVC